MPNDSGVPNSGTNGIPWTDTRLEVEAAPIVSTSGEGNVIRKEELEAKKRHEFNWWCP